MVAEPVKRVQRPDGPPLPTVADMRCVEAFCTECHTKLEVLVVFIKERGKNILSWNTICDACLADMRATLTEAAGGLPPF